MSQNGETVREVNLADRGSFMTCLRLIDANLDFTLVLAPGWRSRQVEKSVRQLTTGAKLPSWRALLFLMSHNIVLAANGGGYAIESSRTSDGSLTLCFRYPRELKPS